MLPLLSGLASGALLVSAYPPFGVPLMAVFALVPLAVWVRPDRDLSAAMSAGAGCATAFFGTQLFWVVAVLSPVTRLSWVAYVGIVGILVLLGAGAASVAWRLGRTGLAPAVSFAIATAGMEWLRAHLGPLAFPWLGVGNALGSTPTLLAPASWLGERGLTFAVALASGLLAAVLTNSRATGAPEPERRRTLAMSTVGVVVLAAVTFGAARFIDDTRRRPQGEARVGIVTTTFGAEGQVGADDRLSWLEAAAAQATESSDVRVDAVLAPEGLLPVLLERRPDFVRRLAEVSRRFGAPLALGAYGTAGDEVFNSTFLVDDTGIIARSDKRRRVPLVESGFGSGSPSGLRAGGLVLGPLVCFESLFSDVARPLVRQGSNVLVNPTSESWFLSGGGRAALHHVEHLRMRAVEVGRTAVRPANDGPSLVVDPDGSIRWTSAGAGVEIVTIQIHDDRTVFVRVGDVLGTLCGLTVLLVLLMGRRLRSDGGR